MYGDNAVSETKLAQGLFKNLPANSIIMADAAYGIFSTAYYAHQTGHNFVLRLTKDRFNRLHKNAELVDSTGNSKSYQLQWTPSAKERATNPTLPADYVITAKIHDLKIGDESLYIVEDIGASPKQLRDLYWKRNDIEVDIRNIMPITGQREVVYSNAPAFVVYRRLTYKD